MRRLYVGFTWAKNYLIISYYKENDITDALDEIKIMEAQALVQDEQKHIVFSNSYLVANELNLIICNHV